MIGDNRGKCEVFVLQQEKGLPADFISHFFGWYTFPVSQERLLFFRLQLKCKKRWIVADRSDVQLLHPELNSHKEDSVSKYVSYDLLKERPLPSQYIHLDMSKLE